MEGIQGNKVAGKVIEFLATDLKGKKVVLQKNTEHPGSPVASSESAFSKNKDLDQFRKIRTGSLRLFGNVNAVSASLRKTILLLFFRESYDAKIRRLHTS